MTEVRIEEVRPHLETRLRQRPPILAVSSLTGRGLERLLDTVEDVFSRYAGRIPTAELNRALAGASRGEAAARTARAPAQHPVRDAGELAPAAVPHLRERPPVS